MEEKDKTTEKLVPPYLSALTLQNALSFLIELGVPAQIDRSVLNKYSGGDQRGIFHAFKYLGFTDDNSHPTALFKEYESGDDEVRKAIFDRVLQDKYKNQVKILSNGTLNQLQSSFGEFQIEASVRKKCISFFLKLAKAAGLPISPHLAKGIRATGPRKGGKAKAKNNQNTDEETSNPSQENNFRPVDGMAIMPIAIGPGITWNIQVPKQPDAGDAEKFLQVIRIVLGVPDSTKSKGGNT